MNADAPGRRTHRILVPLVCLAAGCLSSNRFDTARTLAPGDISHAVSVNFYPARNGNDATLSFLPLPAYGVRVGVADGFDVGARLLLAGHVHLDLKYAPVRTKYFDLAIVPGGFAQLYPSRDSRNDDTVLYGGQVLAMANINLREVSLVPSIGPGVVYAPSLSDASAFVRAGLGLALRLSSVTLQPEISTVYDPARETTVDVTVGMAVVFWDRPTF